MTNEHKLECDSFGDWIVHFDSNERHGGKFFEIQRMYHNVRVVNSDYV